MKQRCRRQQPSPPSQVLRRAPFWVLFFLSFLFFLLILSCCVSVCVCVCLWVHVRVCLGVIALRMVCPCAAARWGPSFVSPSPLLSTHAFSSIHCWWSADGLVMCACVCDVWEGLGRGGVTLLHLTVPFYWWRGGWLACVQKEIWWREESELCEEISVLVLVGRLTVRRGR